LHSFSAIANEIVFNSNYSKHQYKNGFIFVEGVAILQTVKPLMKSFEKFV